MEIPPSLKAEHDELHAELAAVEKLGGRTGRAAENVARLLHAHFVAEEQFALPQLGLLAPLARGKRSPDARRAIELSDRLTAELPKMLAEHQRVVGALDELVTAARLETHPDAVKFAERLKAHARNEEEVLYPAAILVGKYLKEHPATQ